MPFKKFVEIGRVAYLAEGPSKVNIPFFIVVFFSFLRLSDTQDKGGLGKYPSLTLFQNFFARFNIM